MSVNTIEKVNNCILRIRRNDSKAIDELYSIIGAHLRFVAAMYIKDEFIVDDVLQDFWYNIRKYCGSIRLLINGYNYLSAILINNCKAKLRAMKREFRVLTLCDIEQYEQTNCNRGESTFRQIALAATFEKAMKRMTEDGKKVFKLVCYDEMTIRQIAELLGISKSKVDRDKQKALEVLVKTLKEDGWDEE